VKGPTEAVSGQKAQQPHAQGCAFRRGSAEPRRIGLGKLTIAVVGGFTGHPSSGSSCSFTRSPGWGRQRNRRDLPCASRRSVGAAATVSSRLEPVVGSRSPTAGSSSLRAEGLWEAEPRSPCGSDCAAPECRRPGRGGRSGTRQPFSTVVADSCRRGVAGGAGRCPTRILSPSAFSPR
jgi:hypothetical protein